MLLLFRSRWLYLFFTIFFQVTLGGILFGWNALRPLLVHRGVFASECSEGELSPCDKQLVKLDLVFTVGTSALPLSGVVLGPLMDKYGPRLVRIIASFAFIAACLFLGAATNESILWFLGFSCLGIGGGGLQMTSFNVSVLFPGHESVVVSIIAGCFDAGSSIFLFFQKVHDRYGTTVANFFFFYTLNAGCCLVSSFFWPTLQFDGPDDLLLEISDGSIQRDSKRRSSGLLRFDTSSFSSLDFSGEAGGGGGGEKKQTGNELNEALLLDQPLSPVSPNDENTILMSTTNHENKRKRRGGPIHHHHSSSTSSSSRWIDYSQLAVKQQLVKPECNLLILWFGISLLVTTFFLTSESDQLVQMGGKKGGVESTAFSIIYPLGFLATPIVGVLQDHFSFPLVFSIVNLILILYQVVALIPSPPLQILTYILFTTARQFRHAYFFSSLGAMFGYQTFGVLGGGGMFCAALMNLLNYPLQAYCTHTHNYSQVTIAMIVAIALFFVVAILFKFRLWNWRKQQSTNEDGKLVIDDNAADGSDV